LVAKNGDYDDHKLAVYDVKLFCPCMNIESDRDIAEDTKTWMADEIIPLSPKQTAALKGKHKHCKKSPVEV